MKNRIFVAATLLASVCAAHADVLPSSNTSSQANFLSQWTDAKGNDVAASNVLGSNMRLVGGVALGNETAAQALMKKASAAAANGGAVTVRRADGITGTYAVAKSNYKAAAAVGNAVSVTSNSDGDMVISKGATGGGSATSGAAGGSAGGSIGGSAGGSTGSGGGSTSGVVLPPAGSGLGNLTTLPASSGTGTGTNGTAGAALVSNEVPEPSTIALMFVGLAGAMSIARRRSR